MLRVYFARAIDGLDPAEILRHGEEVANAVYLYGGKLIDPFKEVARPLAQAPIQEQVKYIVTQDLALLKTADIVLMDLSIAQHSYIGCICELVYAHSWGIPVIVYVGSSGNGQRTWLRYHASYICDNIDEALKLIADWK